MPQRVRSFKNSLPLDGCGGLTRDVIADAVDALHLVDDTHRNLIQHLVGDTGPVGGHKVAGGHSTESQGIVVGTAVTHNAHGAGVGKDRKILVEILVLAGLGNLIPEDEVGLTQNVRLLLGDVADDACQYDL